MEELIEAADSGQRSLGTLAVEDYYSANFHNGDHDD